MADSLLKCPGCGAALSSSSYKCPACGQDVASFAPTETTAPAGPSAPTGESQIGEFRILRTIGSGGMGTVYEAYQESMHRRVALKVLNAVSPLSSDDVSRFEREAWIGGRLSHPNIVRVYGQGTAGATRYIAMELVEGQSLAVAIRQAKKKRATRSESDSSWRTGHIRRMVSLFAGVADALQHVHEHGIVHRDIKPLNLLLTRDESRLLLTDFGIARDQEALAVTRRGDFMGTVRYMSPEQLLGQRIRVDHRTDIWSLGVSLYEAVTLELPYSGESEEAYIGAVSMREPTPARVRNRAVPRDLETILMKCLERDPEGRYATAALLKDDLARFLEDRPVLARRPGPLLKGARFSWRHRLALGAAVIASILVLAMAGVLSKRARHQEKLEWIRWTLQQVINNPQKEPKTLQPDWAQFQSILQGEVRQSPHGDLALLAQRAACRLTVSAPPFGLVSDLPYISVGLGGGVDPGIAFLGVAYVEGALDDGPWEPIGSAIYQKECENGEWRYEQELDGVFQRAELTPTPHRINLRATYRFFKFDRLSGEAKDYFSKHNFEYGRLERVWPATKYSPVFTETRELDPIRISLSTQYPENFPRKAFANEATGPAQSWFGLDRIRIVRVRLPPANPGKGNGFALEWPQYHDKQAYCAQQNAAKVANPVVGIEFFGRAEPPIPVTADATVSSDQDPNPLLSFTIFWDRTQLRAVGGANGINSSGEASSLYNMADFASSARPLPTLPEGVQDGSTSGRLDFVPSRSVALATKSLDRYFGDKLSIRVPSLEIVTVPGEWVQKEGCR